MARQLTENPTHMRLPAIEVRKYQRESAIKATERHRISMSALMKIGLAAIGAIELEPEELCRCNAPETETDHPGVCTFCGRFTSDPKPATRKRR